MALPATLHWELNASATANMVNGGGFDTACAGFLTNYTATSATGNSPVLSTASYNFVAGDVGHWVYVQAGTNWTPGWYQIASVASNNATLSAAVGQAIQVTNGLYSTNTVAGCATTASPSSGTCGIDYSQGTAAILAATDLVIGADNTTITSVGAPFAVNHPGNILHITAGTNFTQAWYLINSVTAGVAQLDRACGTAASTAGTGKTGGALSLNSTLDDDICEAAIGGNFIWMKAGTFSLGEAISIASSSATLTAMIHWYGYNTTRGDNPTGSSRPVLTGGSFQIASNLNWDYRNFIMTGTGTNVLASSNDNHIENCKFTNTSTTAARTALQVLTSAVAFRCECVSQNGIAVNFSNGTTGRVIGCYIHDSATGFSGSAAGHLMVNNIIEACTTVAFTSSSTAPKINFLGNTFYGAETKLGLGIQMTGVTASALRIYNNIFYGFTTAISISTVLQDSIQEDYNGFFNNTTNRTFISTGAHSMAVDPQFTGASQLTGSTATTSGSILTQSGGDFSTVTDNIDFLYLISGTGKTAGIYLITSHTSTTVTLNNAPGTNATADGIWSIPVGHNFSIGTNLQADGFPGVFGGAGSETTGYLDIGAVQRQESGAAATGGWFGGE